MKNVLTMFKTPNFVKAFSDLESVHQNEDQMCEPYQIALGLLDFVTYFFEDIERDFFVSPSPLSNTDTSVYRVSKVINDEEYVIEVRKQQPPVPLIHQPKT